MRLLLLFLACLLVGGCSRIGQPDLEDLERRLLAPHLDSKQNVKLRPRYMKRAGRVIFVIPKVWGGKPTVHPDSWKLTGGTEPKDAKTLGTVFFLKESKTKKKVPVEGTKEKAEIEFISYKYWAFDNKTNEYLGGGDLDAPALPDGFTVRYHKDTGKIIDQPRMAPDLEQWTRTMPSSD